MALALALGLLVYVMQNSEASAVKRESKISRRQLSGWQSSSVGTGLGVGSTRELVSWSVGLGNSVQLEVASSGGEVFQMEGACGPSCSFQFMDGGALCEVVETEGVCGRSCSFQSLDGRA